MKDFHKLPIATKYEPRWVKTIHECELIHSYHLARCALAGTGKSPSRYDRMIWAASQFSKKHDYVTETGAYKDLDGMLS